MPNTAKQIAIRKAYFELFGDDNQASKVERFSFIKSCIDNNGWFSGNIKNADESLIDRSGHEIRPKSLQGIENNNGWIRMESEEDLPRASIEAHFMLINGDIEAGIFDLVSNTFQNVRREYFLLRQITHYQPIVKPEKPIY